MFICHYFSSVLMVMLRVASCSCNSFLTTSFRSHAQQKEVFDYKNDGSGGSEQLTYTFDGRFDQNLPLKESCSNSPNLSKSYAETQLEIFNHRHGLLVLHLLATLMFSPSLAAWLQVCKLPLPKLILNPKFH